MDVFWNPAQVTQEIVDKQEERNITKRTSLHEKDEGMKNG